jgi:enamine deaminase RidA (YjgF/YER057c/UK114 family)
LKNNAKIEHIVAYPLPQRESAHAACVKAGPWVFINGIEATDYTSGLAPDAAGSPGLPLHGAPKHRREGDFIAARLQELLEQAGTSFANTVRLDQYYSTWKAVDPYHHARRATFGDYIAPSTSVVMRELAVGGADISVTLLAVAQGSGLEPTRVDPPKVAAPVWSGFVPAAIAGDFVFVAGQMSRGAEGSDPRSHVPAHSRWGGYEARKQAEFVIDHRLAPALAAAGSSLGNAVKAQAYVRHAEDIPHFLEVWNDRCGERQVALTIVQGSEFGLADGSLEINLVALRDKGATRKQVIECDIPREATFGPPAVRAGNLLLLSGLMACDRHGAIPALTTGQALQHYGIPARTETACLLDHAKTICTAAGAQLDNVARAVQLHTDLADFSDSLEAWRLHAGIREVPYCAVRVPSHPVPGCRLILDLWIYAPPG